jgi:hypothetical protein
MSAEDWFDGYLDAPHEDWMIECACCRRTFPASDMVVEEGDRWECFPCWEKLNEQEAINNEQKRNRNGGEHPR